VLDIDGKDKPHLMMPHLRMPDVNVTYYRGKLDYCIL